MTELEYSTGTIGNLDQHDISEAVDLLNRAWSQIELINMAAEAGTVTGEAGNAIAWGCIAVQEVVKLALGHLDLPRKRLATNVSTYLSEMLVDYMELTKAINRPGCEGGEAEKLSDQQCEIALAIIGYRPLTKLDERRKAEFLREWAEGSLLTEAEQNALIASMLPEGGAA